MKNWMMAAFAILAFSSCELLDDMPIDIGNGNGSSTTFITQFNPEAIFSPCEEGTDININSLPADALAYIQGNYPGYTIDDADRYVEGSGEIRYGVDIKQGTEEIELLFDANGSLISAGPDTDDVYISIADLPQEVLDYIEAEFPGYTIDEVSIDLEYGLEFFEVELNDDIEVYFSIDGLFACSENSDGDDSNNDDDDDNGNNDDDDDDDDDDNNDDDDWNDDDQQVNLPAAAVAYINNNYPGYQIDEAYLERFCDGNLIEVEIEMGSQDRDLYFTADGVFQFEADDISISALPEAVRSTLQAQYPNYEIDDAEILTGGDSSPQYWVELEHSNDEDEDLDVVLNADGSIFCSFED
ncbi:PepSY-like domain-containing protein [Phaeodactylibacter luteus]|uniref:Putative beta-lactamase-inhibitor-like PepSY-like domain-containing protein n=1 Tax=Phaeodactylibacter luteus TaxID=1564516 RepID=A0A5C6RLP9_9BACT|nr:PepSY-like domain-containing protein [Phaeodactylibacter luteus]TXB62884.1 hypothetical protein FRY97_11855 [Phaeodactylibacter luteus]